MPDPEAVAEVALGWFRRAKSDLATSRNALAARDELDPWVASFHAQQAAEKYLKAALIIEQVRFPRTHELERLRPLLPAGWALPDQEALAGLSRFAVAGRYPEGPFDAGPEPTWSDAEEAVRLAESVETGILTGARSRGIGPPE
jgi:HEPN domain-containing protein